ncbi:MAG: isocitrate/isopropylmalate dehydrogenase family protein [Gemmatimonadota bacterium]|nr:isocitrate/isopropylmalate dehydrogenase family protein [Gemmatimonadota bacterium]
MPTVTLIEGDGIGPEVVGAAVRVVEAAGSELAWDRRLAGLAALDAGLEVLPEETVASFEETGVCLKGPLTTPVGSGFRSVNVAIRQRFDLYANVRPARTMIPGGRYEEVDLVVVRENTEGLYSGIEHYVDPDGDYAESITVVTRPASERVIRFAFERAAERPAAHLTLVHKANILKYTSGLFLEIGREIAGEYPGVAFDDRIIDNMAMQLVLDPSRFDVIVTTNMFGDILSDLCAGLVGGLGLAPASNIGDGAAMFEAVHGSAPDIAGEGIANPAALILAAAALCEHVGQEGVGRAVRDAVERTLRTGEVATPDLGGEATTEEFADAVIDALGG